MRVVIAALSAPPHLNGVSRHAANLARCLLTRPEVTEVHLLCGAWQRQAFEEAVGRADGRLCIHPISIGTGILSRNRWYYADLPRIAHQLDADVLHLAYPVPLAAHAFTCRIVVSLHDLYPFDLPANFGFGKAMLNRMATRRCLQATDAIACVSGFTRERLKHWLGESVEKKAVTIFNVVTPVGGACPKGPEALQKSKHFILSIAQHRRNKNIELTLGVFETVLREGVLPPESMLVILGVPGPETERIGRYIREHRLDRHVRLMSGMSDAELQWCYRNCEMLLTPSSIEGFGLPVVEALLAGCKVVCSDIPAFREVGGTSCRYVALGEGAKGRFVEAVRGAITAPRKTPIAMPGLSAEVIGEKYSMLYRRLLTSPDCPDLSALQGQPTERVGA